MSHGMTPDLARIYDKDSERKVELLDCEFDALPLDRITCPDLKTIAEAWLAMPREAGDALPHWHAFSPAKFKSVLSKLCVLSLEDWRADKLEFTLYGAHATDYIGLGRPLSMQELRDDPARRANYIDIRDRAGRAVENKAPQYVRKTLSWNDRGFIEYEVLMLPFAPQAHVQRVLQPLSARVRQLGTPEQS